MYVESEEILVICKQDCDTWSALLEYGDGSGSSYMTSPFYSVEGLSTLRVKHLQFHTLLYNRCW